MAERQRFGCQDTWPCNCKQTPSLRFPIGQELIEYSSCNNFFVSFLCYFVLWSQIIKDFSITHWCSNEIPIITQRYQKHPFISLQEVFKRLLLRSSTNIKYIFDTVLFSKSSFIYLYIFSKVYQYPAISFQNFFKRTSWVLSDLQDFCVDVAILKLTKIGNLGQFSYLMATPLFQGPSFFWKTRK